MAIVLKEGKTYNPSISDAYGVDMTGSDFYGIVDEFEYKKVEKEFRATINIYGTKAVREAKGGIIDRININCNEQTGFDSKIGPDGISVSGIYALALAEDVLLDWQSDE